MARKIEKRRKNEQSRVPVGTSATNVTSNFVLLTYLFYLPCLSVFMTFAPVILTSR
jgi:hypothetical protein